MIQGMNRREGGTGEHLHQEFVARSFDHGRSVGRVNEATDDQA